MGRRLSPKILGPAVSLVLACSCSAPPPEPEPEPTPPEPIAAAAPGPCDLLTVEQIEEVLEQSVVAGVFDGDGGCTFGHVPNEAGYSAPAVTIRLEYADGSPRAVLVNYQSMLRSALGEYEPEPINDLGDAAAWDGSAVVATVAVESGGAAFVSVQLSDVGLLDHRERDVGRSLAELAIERLKAKDGGI